MSSIRIVHRGTGTYFDLEDDVWVIDEIHIDDETGEIDDDVLIANGKPVDVLVKDGKPVVVVIPNCGN
jgi:hypothetical protein